MTITQQPRSTRRTHSEAFKRSLIEAPGGSPLDRALSGIRPPPMRQQLPISTLGLMSRQARVRTSFR